MSINITSMLRGLKGRPAFLAFISAGTFISSLYLVFIPCWETNDDAAMSMIAHGYGLAAYSSPNLIFSNVLWGYLVRSIPTINGVLGYSLATLTVLLVIGWATLYFLVRLGTGYLLGFLAVALLITLPALAPQFTVNAGLLTVAAVLGWQVYVKLGGRGNLVVACLLAFCGYLIRDKESILVLGMALPLFPWRALKERRQMQFAFLCLSVAIAAAASFDRWSYSGQEWQNFRATDASLTSIIDFHAGDRLKQHPEILARHGYTQNDIDLLNEWYFVDPQIVDPKRLNAMLTELGPLSMQEGNIQSGFAAINAIFSPNLLPLLLSAFILLTLMPRWSVTAVWMLCLAAVFAMGVMGRPGALRVYLPLLSLLLVAPLIAGMPRQRVRHLIVAVTLLVACAGMAYLLIPEALVSKMWAQQVRRDMRSFPVEPVVNWSGEFPFELAFPVLSNNLKSRNINLYGLDAFTLAPFSVASTEQHAGHGILDRLRTASGIPVIASPKKLELLNKYCGEHMSRHLRAFITYQTRSLTIQQVRCDAD